MTEITIKNIAYAIIIINAIISTISVIRMIMLRKSIKSDDNELRLQFIVICLIDAIISGYDINHIASIEMVKELHERYDIEIVFNDNVRYKKNIRHIFTGDSNQRTIEHICNDNYMNAFNRYINKNFTIICKSAHDIAFNRLEEGDALNES